MILIFIGKVCASATTDASNVSNQPLAPKPSRQTAANILGLNRQRSAGQQTILVETEVDQYLSDPNEGTGILEFWQVV